MLRKYPIIAIADIISSFLDVHLSQKSFYLPMQMFFYD